MFLTIFCYNLVLSLCLLPFPSTPTATKIKYIEGMDKLKKAFPWHLLAVETTPCLLQVVSTFSPSLGLVSLEEMISFVHSTASPSMS